MEATEPTFELEACEGLNVLLTLSDKNYALYKIKYPDGLVDDQMVSGESKTITFPSNGIKSIEVTGFYPGLSCSSAGVKSIQTIIALEKPQLISYLNNDLKEIKFNTNLLLEYYIEVNEGSGFKIVDSIRSQRDEYTYRFNSFSQTPSIRVSSFDRCGNMVLSDSLSSVFLEGKAEDKNNALSWTDYNNSIQLSNYTVRKDGDTLIVQNGLEYDDRSVKCGYEYCYFVFSNLNLINTISNKPVVIRSNELCLDAISSDTPPVIDSINSTVTLEGFVNVGWETPSAPLANYYEIYKNNILIDTTSLPEVILGGISSRACYEVSYVDVCGNKSDKSIATCPMFLTVESLDEVIYDSKWTKYEGASIIEDTYLVYLNSEKKIIDSVLVENMTYSFEWPSDTLQEFYIGVFGLLEGKMTNSNLVFIDQDLKYAIPTAFTPDGDGLNDVFEPIGGFISAFELKVFNQWGSLVFTGNSGWDGFSSGKKVVEGAYFYEIVITDQRGESFTETGNITVLY